MIEYLATPLLDGMIAQYAQLMPSISADTLIWRYKANVAGPGLIGQAVEDAKILGMTPFMRVMLKGGDGVLPAFHAIDSIVAPEARGKGLFASLGKVTCLEAREAGAQLVYGFPNAAAAKGWFRHNGWVNHGGAPYMVSPLRSGIFLRRLFKRLAIDLPLPRLPSRLRSVTTITRFDQRFDTLWQHFSKRIGCAVERSSAYLNWRVARHPDLPYTTVAVEEDGALVAYVVYRTAMKHDGHLGYIMEAMALPGREGALVDLMRWVKRDLAQRGCDAVMAMCFSHSANYKLYRRAGFWTIPDKVAPIEVYFGSLAFAPAGHISDSKENWYLSYLDSDSA